MYESTEATLHSHFALCDETYDLLLEENRVLKQTGEPPQKEFLNRKQALLLQFDVSHRAMSEVSRSAVLRHRPLIEKTQRLVLKTLLLDRENEQLLLKCTLSRRPMEKAPPRVEQKQVERTYGESNPPADEEGGTATPVHRRSFPVERR